MYMVGHQYPSAAGGFGFRKKIGKAFKEIVAVPLALEHGTPFNASHHHNGAVHQVYQGAVSGAYFIHITKRGWQRKTVY